MTYPHPHSGHRNKNDLYTLPMLNPSSLSIQQTSTLKTTLNICALPAELIRVEVKSLVNYQRKIDHLQYFEKKQIGQLDFFRRDRP